MAQRKRAIVSRRLVLMKIDRRNIMQCCNNTHQVRLYRQTRACASDLGDGSHVTCVLAQILNCSREHILHKLCGEFRQIYNFGAFANSYETD